MHCRCLSDEAAAGHLSIGLRWTCAAMDGKGGDDGSATDGRSGYSTSRLLSA
jgi:hypothetical protein